MRKRITTGLFLGSGPRGRGASWLLVALLAAAGGAAQAQEKALFLIERDADAPEPSLPGVVVWAGFESGSRKLQVVALPAGIEIEADAGRCAAPLPSLRPESELFLITSPRGTDTDLLARTGRVLWSDGHLALLAADQASAERLATAGMEIAAVLPPPPVPAPELPGRGKTAGAADSVGEIVAAITASDVSELIGDLSGENQVLIGGEPYTILTRNSYREASLEKAQEYCREYFQDQGLAASFHEYTWNTYHWRNVFAVQTGSLSPERIHVICAHLDDMPAAEIAPGADDNASGAAAVLLAARALSGYRFRDTIRYVLFSGEEQGLRGSYYYVQDCAAAGDVILGAINLDMIAYDSDGVPWAELHCGTGATGAASEELAGDVGEIIDTFGLPLDWVAYTDGSTRASDHARFWDAGYPAVLGIEDTWVGETEEFNPYYHTAADTRANCNLAYATAFARAAAGATALRAVPVPSPSPAPPSPSPSPSPSPAPPSPSPAPSPAPTAAATATPAATPTPTPAPRTPTPAAPSPSPGRPPSRSPPAPTPSPLSPPLPDYFPADGDYAGNGTAAVALYRPASGEWLIRGVTRFVFGSAEDRPSPLDFDGDGTTDAALFRPARGLWSIRSRTRIYFGTGADLAVPGDFDGDGTDDPAVFRPETGLWAVRDKTRMYFGSAGDYPLPGRWGGGEAVAAIVRPDRGLWAARGTTRFHFGKAGDIPLRFDHDGDGVPEAACFRPHSGLWAVRSATRYFFGGGGDRPVAADFRGDGRDLPAIFRGAGGRWWLREQSRFYFGAEGDLPLSR